MDPYGEAGRRRAATGRYRAWMEYVRSMRGRQNVEVLSPEDDDPDFGRIPPGLKPDADAEKQLAMPGYVAWALEHRADKFTPAQRQALALWAGPERFTQEQMAERAGCNRSAFRKRLAGAQRALAIVLEAEARGRPSTVRRGANRGRAKMND